ncbi:MAG: tetratricopeptide repeat protein [Prevotellaceae bacterium]|jgi:tetratricopeptide (TPR) repeat protein|nr:tetratricopeptide repeat protein [Prevotellaceae bacterium]
MTVKEYFDKGFEAYDNGDYEEAIEYLSKAIELDPNKAAIYGLRGEAKYKLSDYSGAIEDFSKAIELGLNEANTYNNRGNAKYELSDYSGAIEDLSKAIELDPNDARAYYNRGNAKYELSDYSGAIEDFSKAGCWDKVLPCPLYLRRLCLHQHLCWQAQPAKINRTRHSLVRTTGLHIKSTNSIFRPCGTAIA